MERAPTMPTLTAQTKTGFRAKISHACTKRSHVLFTDDLHSVAIALDDISALEKEAQTPSGQGSGGSRSKPTLTKSSARCGEMIAPLVIVTQLTGRTARRVQRLKFQGETECAEHRTGRPTMAAS